MNEIGECLSSVTQKKGELNGTEKQAILKYGSAWGCDICQDACPYTKSAISSGTIYTNIDFFKENRIARPTAEIVENMDSEEFKKRAYSWRGKNPIIRNLRILENKEN
jgi:epoxyqueuosine reductase QueG